MSLFGILDGISAKDGLAYLTIGGHALNAYGYSRFTHDLDILVSRNDREAWLAALARNEFTLDHDGGAFLQMKPLKNSLWRLDLMLVNQATFESFLSSSTVIQQGGSLLRVPALEHLIALKLHALKNGPKHRGFKDLTDILSLAQINKMDVGSDSFRALCERYGSKEIYERLVTFNS